MTKLFLIAASTILSVASSPVVARDARPAATTEQADAPRAEQPAVAQRYCVVSTITGSRIPHKTCHTRAEWMNEGFDPLNPEK